MNDIIMTDHGTMLSVSLMAMVTRVILFKSLLFVYDVIEK